MKSILEAIFYLCVIISLYYELQFIVDPATVMQRRISQKEYGRVTSGDNINGTITYSLFGFIAALTCLIGLMSSQWIFFFVYFMISLIATLLYKKLYKYKLVYVIDGIVCSLILFTILLNKFHFHYTSWQIWNLL